MRRPSWLVIVAVLLGPSIPAFAAPSPVIATPDPVALDKARAIVAVILPEERRDAMMQSMMASMSSQIRSAVAVDMDPGAKAIFDRYQRQMLEQIMPVVAAHMPDMTESIAQAYARNFTPAELDDILAFATSPAGAKYLARAPELLSDAEVAASNQRLMAATMAIGEKFRDELTTELSAYYAEHPKAAGKKPN